ncbi:serine/threonine-protein kinase [Actinomadura gamaensis]|uniref:non-specific serine/threonine protein kinase n=1 Tax=Actinomadura gamaensis TaxID=1763541 RepID=A0ABV9U354_9ACTN
MAEGDVTGPGTDVPLAGRYRLLSVLGRGGMGTVWRASDETLDREVAIKEIRLHPSLTDEERSTAHARMMREARASARLGHPSVVTVHDVVVHDDRPWMVMELVPSRSLQDIVDEDGPQPPQRIAALGRQVAAALRAAHAVGILHRDVKPANVLITAEDRAVLTDFGIAQLSGDATLTRTGMVMGSPAYMAPERVKGEAAGPASDVWALGATLYAAVEGQAPHHRSDAMAVLAAIMTLDAPPPRRAGPLAPVLTAMLDREPANRPSIDQVEQELGRIGASSGAGRPTAMDAQVPVPPAWTEKAQQVQEQGVQHVQTHDVQPQQLAFPDDSTRSVQSRSGGRNKIVLAVVGAVAAMALVAGGVYYAFGRNKDTAAPPPTNPATGGATDPGSESPAPTASPSKPKPKGPPPGMTFQRLGGLRVAVPVGWKRQNDSTFIDPATHSYVQVDDRVWTGTPDGHWRTWIADPKTQEALRGFTNLGIETTSAKNGEPAADLEFTWLRGNELTHALDRGFRKGGKPYAVIVVAPQQQWPLMRPALRQVLESAG